MHLIGVGLALFAFLENWAFYLEAALALGAVIFVHELGHFVVAKLCGVKCEKFYIGFDIGGYKLLHFQWGETEYGIGILPLGGYVKMLGQDDNPTKYAEEMERARAKAVAAGKSPDSAKIEYDPRSYPAQSVLERMAIISAGVIMNIISGFLVACWAYSLGVEYQVAELSGTIPGQAAWQEAIRPGDQIVQIGDDPNQVDNPHLDYDDVMQAVVHSDPETGVRLKIARPGEKEPFWVPLVPNRQYAKKAGRSMVGFFAGSALNQLSSVQPFLPDSPSDVKDGFKPSDRIVAINGKPVATYAEIQAELAQHPTEELHFSVVREPSKPEGKSRNEKEPNAEKEAEQQLEITVPKNPVRRVGLVMKMSRITAIEKGSPADKAGLKPEDFITEIEGEPVGSGSIWDPLILPEKLRRMAASGEKKTVQIKVTRDVKDGQSQQLSLDVELRNPHWYELPLDEGWPMSAPAIGIAYRVMNVIQSVEKINATGADGEKTPEIAPNDTVVSAKFVYSEKQLKKNKDVEATELKFDEEQPNWPYFMEALQQSPPDTKIELTIKHGEKTSKVVIVPEASSEWFYPRRGLIFAPKTQTLTATSLGESIQYGGRRMWHDMTQIVRTLRSIATGKISVKSVGGPLTIAAIAGMQAKAGFVKLLMFICLISANLAVINFLPIPILDGGHMMFLLYEGIRGQPPSDRVMNILSLIGLAFILTLMVAVITLDISRFIGG